MLSEKQFEYYTSPNFVIESSYWEKIKGKLDQIESLAESDIQNQSKIRSKNEFKSNAEYQIYLMCLCNYAWADKLGTTLDSLVEE